MNECKVSLYTYSSMYVIFRHLLVIAFPEQFLPWHSKGNSLSLDTDSMDRSEIWINITRVVVKVVKITRLLIMQDTLKNC